MADMNTFMPSTPLQLSGFLTGDTIQVKGDTGCLKFSVQFSVQEKQIPDVHHNLLNSLDANASCPENNFSENESVSSYMTPNKGVQEAEDDQSDCGEQADGVVESGREGGESNVVTRLRSGAITPVNYFRRTSNSGRSLIRASGKKNGGKIDVFERVLRRHSCPIRPCNSYAFFVMATWGFIKCCSFSETSKQLGKMWCQFPPQEKKVYEEMAMKDNARYKRQCMQLIRKPHRILQKGRRRG